jgi:hypothetical protein
LGLKLLMILFTAATLILEADLGLISSINALLILIALMPLGEIILVVLYARDPATAHVWLSQFMTWLKTAQSHHYRRALAGARGRLLPQGSQCAALTVSLT